jgi:hypothetical protein
MRPKQNHITDDNIRILGMPRAQTYLTADCRRHRKDRPKHCHLHCQLLYLAPTESWSDRGQNCLHDMRIVGNA